MRTLNDTIQWRKIVAALFIVFLVCVSLSLAADGVRDNPVLMSQRFLKAVYPDLQKQHLLHTISETGTLNAPWDINREFDIVARHSMSPVGYLGDLRDGVLQPSANVQVAARFVRGEDGRLLEFVANGFLLHSEELQHIVEQSNQHIEWTDEQVISALKESGARFGPNDKEAFLQQLSLQSLEPFIGTTKFISSEFRLREPEREGSFTHLYWDVRIEVHSADSPTQYSLLFEPYTGKLFHLFVVR